MLSTSVLIVGAGPVGLQLALDLGWRGVRCIVIDKDQDITVEHPRAAGISARTMEFCRRWGIAEKVRHGGFPLDYPMNIVYCTALAGFLIDRQQYPCLKDLPPLAESPENKHRLPQPYFDPIIAAAAKSHPSVQVLHGHRLTSFDQLADKVVAKLVDRSGAEQVEVHAHYMVACDGVNSEVRKRLGISYDGNPALSYSVNVVFRSENFAERNGMGPAERYLFIGNRGTWANMTVINGRDLWRFTLVGSQEKLSVDNLDLRQLIRTAIGDDAIAFDILAVAPWRRSEQLARNFRSGRVFLAGDAAHTMSPTGGMGMNTGAGDAVDLGWKLDAVLKSWAPDSLLNSYEEERKPVARRNIDWSSANFRNWIAGDDCREIADNTATGELARLAVGRRLRESLSLEWEQSGIQLGYRYDNSSICVKDDGHPPADHPSVYVQSSYVGARAPHVWLSPGRSTLDIYGRGFVLVNTSGTAALGNSIGDEARRIGVPLTVHHINDAGTADLHEKALVLVRPDGHVAWRGDRAPDNPRRLLDTVRGVYAGRPP